VALVSAATLVIGGTIVGAAWWTMRPAPPPVVRMEVTTEGATALSLTGNDRDLAITPDGSRVIYRGGNNQLLVRALDQLEPEVLSGLGAPRGLFVSPDGQWVGFFDGNSLKKVAITGGPPVTLGTADGASRGATWGDDGTIVYATATVGTGLQRVSAAGGDPTVLTTSGGGADHLWPEFLPGGQAVLFTIMPAARGGLDNAQIAVLDFRTNTQTVLVRGGSHAHYVPTGHLVYAAGGALRAVPFDLGRLAVVGTPVPVVEEVFTTGTGGVDAVVAANGTLVYVAANTATARSLVWIGRDGAVGSIATIPADAYASPRLSPDGRSVLVSVRNDVWIYDIASGRRTRVTRDGLASARIAWDPTGSLVAYTSTRGGGGSPNVWVQPSDGSSEARQLTKLDGAVDVDWWSPDGRVLAVHHHGPDGIRMLMLSTDKEGSEPQPFVEDEPGAEGASFSPDGRYLAYMSTESGQREIYIRAYPRSGGRTTVSVGGGREPVWARNGELYYRNLTGDRMMAVTVTTKPTLRVGGPSEVFAGRFVLNPPGGGPQPFYDVTRDGPRFLMLKEGDGSGKDVPRARFIIVQNRVEELKRLVPTN
jgi:serine/threonine-protein kinase